MRDADDDAGIHALLRSLDHPLPAVSAADVIARARRPRLGWRRIAAGILVGLALTGVAWAVPGSPMRAWWRTAVQRLGAPSRPAPAPAEPAQVPSKPAGIAVVPGSALVIQFRQATGRVTVSLTDSAEVVVRGPAGAATFTAEGARLVVDNAQAASFEILLPRAAARIEIRAGTRRLLLKDGTRLITAASGDAAPPLTLDLAPGGR